MEIEELAEQLKSLTVNEWEKLNAYLQDHSTLVAAGATTTDPLPPDPTHPKL